MTSLYDDCHKVGGMSKYAYEDDPKRLAFTLARYKHTAKLLEGFGCVLEVGCADGFGSRIVRQHVENLYAIDTDLQSIIEAQAANSDKFYIEFIHADITDDLEWLYMRKLQFDAVYCLDVLEHIPPGEKEMEFLERLSALARVAVIGTPSLESQPYASRLSKEGHVNCKTGPQLRETLFPYWNHVFLFSMNDEALGTGFAPMAQYRLALCAR